MTKFKNIPYASEHGKFGLLDVCLPVEPEGKPIVLVIHGGGLKEFSKERMTNVCAFLVERGWAAVSMNYRLLPEHPFPVQVEDTIAALRWIQAGKCNELRSCDFKRVTILGASAGGYLALTAGFIMGSDQVRAVVSISGPTRPGRYNSRQDPQASNLLLRAPIELIQAGVPPVLAVHSRNDRLVNPDESITLVESMLQTHLAARLYLFSGDGSLHGIWQDPSSSLPRLLGHIEDVIAKFIKDTL